MKVAYALVNKGIGYTYDPFPGNSVSANRDVTNFQQTFQPYPYDFDARGGQAPAYRNTWYRNIGIRGQGKFKNYRFCYDIDSSCAVRIRFPGIPTY
jgi:hypothetical protein